MARWMLARESADTTLESPAFRLALRTPRVGRERLRLAPSPCAKAGFRKLAPGSVASVGFSGRPLSGARVWREPSLASRVRALLGAAAWRCARRSAFTDGAL